MKLQAGKETDFNIIGRDGHTGYTNNSRSVQLVCLYLFEYQDAYQMNTNIRIIRIYSNNGIRMRPLVETDIPSILYSSLVPPTNFLYFPFVVQLGQSLS